VRNRSIAVGMMRKADPEFPRAIALLHDVQVAGALAMRVQEDNAQGSTAVIFLRVADMTARSLRRWLRSVACSSCQPGRKP